MRGWVTTMVATVLALAAWPALALSRSERQQEVIDPLNHAFAVYLGGGLYVTGDSTVFIIRAAPKIRLLDERERPFGLGLRFTGQIGFYDTDLKFDDIPDLPDNVGTWAFVPGVEFPIRIYDNWTLMPFADIGVASDTKFHDTTVVTGFGTRSRAEFRGTRHLHVLWNELVVAANHDDSFRSGGDYSLFRIDYEMRGVVDYRLFDREFDLGLLVLSESYLNSPVIDLGDDDLEIRQRFEIGFTTGATERWKALKNKVTTPRLGVSYRFGEGTSGVRFVIRFRN